MFMAMESVLRTIVQGMGLRKGSGEFARFLKDNPDKFPMFPTVPDELSSEQEFRRCKSTALTAAPKIGRPGGERALF
jgi:hypothetical protein